MAEVLKNFNTTSTGWLFMWILLIIGIFMIAIAIVLYIMKPTYFFNEDGSMKKYGIGSNCTLFSYHIVVLLSGILAYYYQSIISPIN